MDNIPIKSLASVPELPKLSSTFFLATKEPKPFPKIKYSPGFFFTIFTPNFFKQFIVDKTSSDSSTFFADEIF